MGSERQIKTGELDTLKQQLHAELTKDADCRAAEKLIPFEQRSQYHKLSETAHTGATSEIRENAARDMQKMLKGYAPPELTARVIDLHLSAGASTQKLIAEKQTDKALELNQGIGSGKFKSADDIFAQMSAWGYTSFVKTELARLAAYKATELKQQMALFEVSNERTDAAQYAREFALSLRELTRYVPESKDEFERYAGMFNEIAALGKEVKMDGTVGAEIKKTALDITKNLDRLLGSVVAESNKTIEATVKDTAKLGRHKLTATELPKIKIKPEPSAVTRFDGRAEQKENEREPKREDTKLGTREETETVFEPHGTDGFDGEPHDGLEPLSTDVKPYETRTIINSPSKPL